jgi:hypothetical protein
MHAAVEVVVGHVTPTIPALGANYCHGGICIERGVGQASTEGEGVEEGQEAEPQREGIASPQDEEADQEVHGERQQSRWTRARARTSVSVPVVERGGGGEEAELPRTGEDTHEMQILPICHHSTPSNPLATSVNPTIAPTATTTQWREAATSRVSSPARPPGDCVYVCVRARCVLVRACRACAPMPWVVETGRLRKVASTSHAAAAMRAESMPTISSSGLSA